MFLKEGKIHIPFGTMGTTTGRNAPKAKYFLFAQSAWQRTLVRVPKGMKLVAFDYCSEEIFVGAVFHKDKKMLKAYFEKDYYLYIGLMVGMVLEEDFNTLSVTQLKNKYIKERKLLKLLTLGISYLMGVSKMATQLYPNIPQNRGYNRAKKLVDKFKYIFKDYFKNGRKFVSQSHSPRILHHWGYKLLEKNTTANNFPIQGSSAEILHLLAIALANRETWSRGIYMFSMLHDGCYFFIKDDNKLQENIDYVIQVMKDKTAEILNYYEHKIEVGYTITSHGETFIEKDHETAIMINELIGRTCNFSNFEEIVK